MLLLACIVVIVVIDSWFKGNIIKFTPTFTIITFVMFIPVLSRVVNRKDRKYF